MKRRKNSEVQNCILKETKTSISRELECRGFFCFCFLNYILSLRDSGVRGGEKESLEIW